LWVSGILLDISQRVLGHPKSFFQKNFAPREAIHDHFRFSASRRGSFFALPASVSLSGVSGQTNFLAKTPTSIQKSPRFFANLASASVAQAKVAGASALGKRASK